MRTEVLGVGCVEAMFDDDGVFLGIAVGGWFSQTCRIIKKRCDGGGGQEVVQRFVIPAVIENHEIVACRKYRRQKGIAVFHGA